MSINLNAIREPGRTHYSSKEPWPANCEIQSGGADLRKFFEAFPKSPNCYIRGEGVTFEQAEHDAWLQYEKYQACKGHEYETRGYTNGGGFCKHCNMFQSNIFSWPCKICKKPTNHIIDKQGNYYCDNCEDLVPDSDQTESYKSMVKHFQHLKTADVRELVEMGYAEIAAGTQSMTWSEYKNLLMAHSIFMVAELVQPEIQNAKFENAIGAVLTRLAGGFTNGNTLDPDTNQENVQG